jgi:hypothetical protein
MTARAAVVALLAWAARAGCKRGDGRAAVEHPGEAADSTAADSSAAHLLDRVAVIGASVSAGFASPSLATSLRAGLPATADVLDAASVAFFRDPFANGRAAVDAARAHRPTLTLALDFLFWFAYVDAPADARLQRLDDGLALLATIPGSLAVGDLPDMRNANPRMLGPAAVPPAAELATMNARIHAWASARPATLVLPMAAWTAPLVTGAEIELAPGERVPAAELMFLDGLHPNGLGAWHLLRLVDETLERERAVPAATLRPVRPS